MITLPFEPYLYKLHVFLAPSSSEKLPIFSNAAFEKRMEHPPGKMSLVDGHGFSRRRDNKPHLKSHIQKVMLLIYRMMSRMLGFGEWITYFGGN
jgi:hypothetical protein